MKISETINCNSLSINKNMKKFVKISGFMDVFENFCFIEPDDINKIIKKDKFDILYIY